MASVVISATLVLLEFVRLLIDCVVRQVHEQIVQVAVVRSDVLRRGKSCQAFFVQKDSQRCDTRYQNIDSEVELESVYQVRLVKIPLANVMLLRVYPVVVASQKNAFSLAAVLRLDDKGFGLALVELVPEFFVVARQKPRLWKELIVTFEVALHGQQVLGQQIFPGHCIHAGKVVRSLIRLHLHEECWNDGPINKPDVPVFFAIIYGCSKIALLGHFMNDFILGVKNVDHERRPIALCFRLRWRNRLHGAVLHCDALGHVGTHRLDLG